MGGASRDTSVTATPRKCAFRAPEIVCIPEVAGVVYPTCGSRMKFAYRVSGGRGRGSGRAIEGSEDAGET